MRKGLRADRPGRCQSAGANTVLEGHRSRTRGAARPDVIRSGDAGLRSENARADRVAPRCVMSARNELRIEQLLGRKLLDQQKHAIGRIEEFRAQRRGQGCVSTEIIVGMMGLIERLDLGAKLLVGGRIRGYVVRWD